MPQSNTDDSDFTIASPSIGALDRWAGEDSLSIEKIQAALLQRPLALGRFKEDHRAGSAGLRPPTAWARTGKSSCSRQGSVASTAPVGGGLRRGPAVPGSGTRHQPPARGSGLAPPWAGSSGRRRGRRRVQGFCAGLPQSARRLRWGSRRGGDRGGAPGRLESQ